MNSPDLNLSELRTFTPLPVYDSTGYVSQNSCFTLFGNRDHARWYARSLC